MSKPALRLAVTTFSILVLELALIRWLGTQVRFAAYFANLVLLSAFLGMGLGVGLARRRPGLARWALPALAIVCVLVAAATPLGLTHMQFPDPAISLWASNERGSISPLWQFAGAALMVTGCFWLVASIFLLLGVQVGVYFDALPPLNAYGADLGGSLAGVVAMAVIAGFWAPPPVWIALGALPLIWIFPNRWSVVAAIVAVAAAAYSVDGARFSPYNRLDLFAASDSLMGPNPGGRAEWELSANRDYHQNLLDLRPNPASSPMREHVRNVYELPFSFSDRSPRSALVVGAGSGNDVAAALRKGYDRVVSIDIDPAILSTGEVHHPEQPYSNPRVFRIADDARAYLGRTANTERFDVVCYGLLDSHAMFSSMSSLRLDNFVYTTEGLRGAWSRVKPDGILSVSFSMFAGDWIYYRMLGIVKQATGMEPYVVKHGYNLGATFLVGRTLSADKVREAARAVHANIANGESVPASIRIPTDDWPFLYLKPGTIPWTYITVFLLVGLSSAWAVHRVFGKSLFSRGRFDAQMFLLGAAFLLLETRAVTQLSLLFGSTWIVNTSVFGGVLAMVLAANTFAARVKSYRRELWYGLLAASLIALWLLPLDPLFELDLAARAAVAGLAAAVPVFFAGVIFSSELRARPDSAAALGSNLCGAVVGGLLENFSMLTGLRAIVLFALVFYLLSMLIAVRRPAAQTQAA
jgi:spermidine synthase